jgi:hypothetical protein
VRIEAKRRCRLDQHHGDVELILEEIKPSEPVTPRVAVWRSDSGSQSHPYTTDQARSKCMCGLLLSEGSSVGEVPELIETNPPSHPNVVDTEIVERLGVPQSGM